MTVCAESSSCAGSQLANTLESLQLAVKRCGVCWKESSRAGSAQSVWSYLSEQLVIVCEQSAHILLLLQL